MDAYIFLCAHTDGGHIVPRMTIYVPDDLKRRMDQVEEDRLWSGVAQQAFEAELTRRQATKGVSTMQDVIERLRASKETTVQNDYDSGWNAGVKWAKGNAEYDELKRAAQADIKAIEDDEDEDAFPVGELYGIIMGEYGTPHEVMDFTEDLYGERHTPTAAECRGFLAGAESVWDEIKDHL